MAPATSWLTDEFPSLLRALRTAYFKYLLEPLQNQKFIRFSTLLLGKSWVEDSPSIYVFQNIS